MANTRPLKRVFIFNGKKLADPDPLLSPRKVCEFWSATDAGLLNAVVEGPDFAANPGCSTYVFRIAAGDKG